MRYDWKNELILVTIAQDTPTVAELAKVCGLAASSAHDRLKGLRNEGMIEWVEGQHRSIRLTGLGKQYMEENYGEGTTVPQS